MTIDELIAENRRLSSELEVTTTLLRTEAAARATADGRIGIAARRTEAMLEDGQVVRIGRDQAVDMRRVVRFCHSRRIDGETHMAAALRLLRAAVRGG